MGHQLITRIWYEQRNSRFIIWHGVFTLRKQPLISSLAVTDWISPVLMERCKILQVQGKDPSVEFTQDIVEESEDERCFDEMMSGSDTIQVNIPVCNNFWRINFQMFSYWSYLLQFLYLPHWQPIDLPNCEIAKLEEISELVNSCLPSPIRREKLAVAIENEVRIT